MSVLGRKGVSNSFSLEDTADKLVMAISDTSNTRTINSNSYPNTNLEIHREVWHSFQDVA